MGMLCSGGWFFELRQRQAPPMAIAAPANSSLLQALVFCRCDDGSTPLHRCGAPMAARVLGCLCHVDLEAKMNIGGTPLSFAASYSSLSVVQELLRQGAHVNHQNSSRSALVAGAHRHHQGIVLALLEAGAEVDALDEDGYTVLDIVCMCCDSSFVDMILEWTDPSVPVGSSEMSVIVNNRMKVIVDQQEVNRQLADGAKAVP